MTDTTGTTNDQNVVLEVSRAAHGEARLLETDLPDLAAGPGGQVRLRIDRFALTANNITYADVGELLGYWDFFPATDGWGRVPAMGWADVVESTHPEVETGGRYYGWYPMARYLDITVGVTGDGLRDDGPHRLKHAPVYRSIVDTRHDPYYEASGDGEDRHALLRGLFLTAFLADEFFADANYFDADTAIVLSASSKTAIGFAQRASERGVGNVVGVTSASNAEFVRSLGFYDTVLAYGDLEDLPADANAVSIDMSGNQTVLARLHDHLGDHLTYSMIVGRSHHDAAPAEITAGPTPQLFFAPTEVTRRLEAWGRAGYDERVAAALAGFVAGSHTWLTVERSTGAKDAETTYHDIYAGTVAPSIGKIVSLHDH